MKKLNALWISGLLLLASALTHPAASQPPAGDGLLQEARSHFAPLPGEIETPENPLTTEKTRLGKMLFYETRISIDRTVSCFKCHWINLYATDGLKKAIGNNYRPNPRNAQTVFNAAGQISQHWIGNRTSVEDQAKQALLGAASYGLASFDEAGSRLKAIAGYEQLFKAAFPNDPNPVNAENFAKAIGAWERTLVTPSRFDSFLDGDSSALNENEKSGLSSFMRLGCVQCHNGTYVGGAIYAKFGLTQPYWNLTHSVEIDDGRFAVTKKDEDRYVFKVPVLRNVAMTSPYFHDGSIDRLEDVVRTMAQLQLGINLDDSQEASIVAFLKALTGKIPDDALTVPVLPPEN